MLRISVLNKQTALRAKELGALGEALAQRYLERAGFTGLLDLNTLRKNFPFADVVASRGRATYAISVKTRNKYEARTDPLTPRLRSTSNANSTRPPQKQFPSRSTSRPNSTRPPQKQFPSRQKH
jgi:hypothetical protein